MIPIRELATVVGGRNGPGLMALLRAYLDASRGGGLFAVGGFVGRAEDWEELEPKWQEALETFRLSDFHLADIFHDMGHEKGSLCVLHFSLIMGRSKLRGIGASCDIDHWQSRDTGYDNPYHFCFSMALDILRQETELELGAEPVALVVDDDVRPRDITEGIFAAYKRESPGTFASITFGNRRTFQPLQCADLAVGALRKEWLGGFMSRNRRALREFQGAIGGKSRFSHFSAETERLVAEALEREKLNGDT